MRGRDVFLNCPFDESYRPLFNAIVFAIHDLGFVPRCALELDDASEVRLIKIMRIIGQCTYGIHDISSVELSTMTRLPRFNMPLELGIFLGCQRFGARVQKSKRSLILDRRPFRYRASISDLSGQDVHVHKGQPLCAIIEVRNWLANASGVKGLPGGKEIAGRYRRFVRDLPSVCERLKRDVSNLTFADYAETVEIWLEQTH